LILAKTPSRARFYAVSLLLLITLSACSPFAPQQRHGDEVELPQQFSLYRNTVEQPTKWWTDFAWEDLDGLIDKALAQNLSLQESWARLQQAQANVTISSADKWPYLYYSDEASHSRQQEEGDSQFNTTNSFSLALASSYEVDLWGRVAANIQADTLTAQASADDWHTARLTIAAQVAQTWINLVAQNGLVPLAQQRWQRAVQQLQLLQLRYQQGMATGMDVAEQQRRVAEYRALILPMEEQQQQLAYELALLVGELPSWRWSASQTTLPQFTTPTNIGIPADLLAQRPDVRAAGLRLQAADWYVSAAQAERLPALSLSASLSNYSSHLNELFDNWLANLAASVTGPIFDAGQRRAAVDSARAIVDERLANYKQTVLTAMSEVETALMQERKRAQELQAINTQLEHQRNLCAQQQRRYINGDGGYLAFLESQQTFNLLQQQQLQMQRDLLLARSALHRAIGGHMTL